MFPHFATDRLPLDSRVDSFHFIFLNLSIGNTTRIVRYLVCKITEFKIGTSKVSGLVPYQAKIVKGIIFLLTGLFDTRVRAFY